MVGVTPKTFRSAAHIVEETLEFEPSWKETPFDDYDGMNQQQYQDAVAPFLLHGKLVPVAVPKGWRRVESARPGKHFYVHMATGTISAFPKDIYNCQANEWMTKEGEALPATDVTTSSAQRRTLRLAYPNGVPADGEEVEPQAALPALPAPVPSASSTAKAEVAEAPQAAKSLPVGLLFPGQGSQYVKMLSSVADIPSVQEILSSAQRILGYDLADICMNGPEEKLERTEFCQPAMYIGGLAAIEKLKQTKPECVERCQAVAGLSLGEYTALTVAGVFDFETGLKLVKLRGEAMQAAAEASPQSMVSVAGLNFETLSRLCQEACDGPEDVLQVANFLFPNGFACAGTTKAAERLMDNAKAAGALQARLLKTSGAFHTKLMQPAKEKLLAALQEAEPKMKPPRCDVYMNTTGKKITADTSPSEIVGMLAEQLVSCVQWEPSMRAMIDDGVRDFYECGPMKQLKAMMKRIDADTFKSTTNVEV